MHAIIPSDQNPHLRETAREILLSEIRTPEIQKLIEEMKALLAKEEYGVALAASQIGEPLRLFIVSGKAIARNARDDDDDDDAAAAKEPALPDQVYINPELLKLSRGKVGKHEGCLSIRGKWGIVPRAEKATIRAYDEEGRRFTRCASGFLAHVFQHEMDHLDGVLYIDKATEVYDDEPDEK